MGMQIGSANMENNMMFLKKLNIFNLIKTSLYIFLIFHNQLALKPRSGVTSHSSLLAPVSS